MPIHACIFDMDGVIVDSAKYHFQSWKRLANELKVDFSEEMNEQLKGISRVDSLEKILSWGNLHLDNDTKLELMEKKNEWYLELIANMDASELLEGVLPLLKELKRQGVAIALGSSSKNAKRILDIVNITSYFDAVVDGNMVTFSKPDPEVFLKGASLVKVAPKHCVVFEDAEKGVEAALRGGFRCVGLGHENQLGKAHVVLPSLAGITLDRLKNLLD